MIDFIQELFTGDLHEILGDDLYAPTAAAVAAAWAILALAGTIEVFKNVFNVIFNVRSGRK